MYRVDVGEQHKRFYCLFSLMLILISVKYALQIDIPRMTFLFFILLIAFLGDRNEIIAICMCCIPLHEAIDFFYAIFFCVAIFILKYPKDVKINLSAILFILMFIWEMLHCINMDYSVMELLISFIPLLVLIVYMSVDLSICDYAFVSRMVAIATVAIGVMLLGKELYQSDFNIAVAFASLQRLGSEIEGINTNDTVTGAVNPNILGIICVIASAGLIQLRSRGEGKVKDLILIISLLVFGTLTSSRTYLVCLGLMLILFLFSQKGDWSKKIRFFGTIIFVLFLGIMVLKLLFPELLQYYIARFNVSDITTGRAELMSNYHKFIVSEPGVLSWGIGLQNFSHRLVNVYSIARHAPHNGIQELVIAWGIPGLLMFGMLLIMMILQSNKYCKQQMLVNYIPLLIIIAKAQAGQMIISGYTMLTFSYAYLSLTQNFRQKLS